jgi:hypothetical protein
MKQIAKLLSGNDLGITGGHQAGVLLPKTDPEILQFFPDLDKDIKNPSKILEFLRRDNGKAIKLRFVYYNSRFHGGTRNEYRLTGLTRLLRELGASVGDQLVMSDVGGRYFIEVVRKGNPEIKTMKIKLSGSWSTNGR